MRWYQVLVGEKCFVEMLWFIKEVSHHGIISLTVGSLIISFYVYYCWVVKDRV